VDRRISSALSDKPVRRARILITPRLRPETVDEIRALLEPRYEVVYSPKHPGWSRDELRPLLANVEGVLAGGDTYDDLSLNSASKLAIIARLGAGYDLIDVQAASRRGVYVTTTPGANADAVADLAMGLIIALVRSIPANDATMKSGLWLPRTGRDLSQLTLGLVGMGAIGSRVLRRARAFDMQVLAFDPLVGGEVIREAGGVPGELADVLERSAIVSLHLPLSDQTRGIVDRTFLRQMHFGSYLVNTSRGGLINEAALLAALDEGHIAGAALDVFASEPPTGLSLKLSKHPRVIASPHVAGDTIRAVQQSVALALESIVEALEGRVPPRAVNRDLMVRRHGRQVER
jgi:phosphoglycerate dehydrogenase-like enzyme